MFVAGDRRDVEIHLAPECDEVLGEVLNYCCTLSMLTPLSQAYLCELGNDDGVAEDSGVYGVDRLEDTPNSHNVYLILHHSLLLHQLVLPITFLLLCQLVLLVLCCRDLNSYLAFTWTQFYACDYSRSSRRRTPIFPKVGYLRQASHCDTKTECKLMAGRWHDGTQAWGTSLRPDCIILIASPKLKSL